MASPKNWSREKRAENQRAPYIWNHTESNKRVIVMRRGKKYRAELYQSEIDRASGNPPIMIVDKGRNKEDVRSEAVDWMKRHPEGLTNRP